MTQTELIERILTTINMMDANHKLKRTEKEPAYKDLNGKPCCLDCRYRSIVGMMLYLTGSYQPNIAHTLHQCARFSHNQKLSNEVGLKHISRYLKVTRDIGLIMVSNRENIKLDSFADMDFAELYATEEKLDSTGVKNR